MPKSSHRHLAAFALATLCAVGPAARAATVYDNSSQANDCHVGAGGQNHGNAAVGATLLAPTTDNIVSNFTLVQATFNNPIGQLRGYVGTWTGTGVGTILYTSELTPVNMFTNAFAFDAGVRGGTLDFLDSPCSDGKLVPMA